MENEKSEASTAENPSDAAKDEASAVNAAPSVPKIPRIPPAADLAAVQEENKRLYWDRSHYDSPSSQMNALVRSSTLYVGNLAFSTRSRHIRAHFSLVGTVKTVRMGLDRNKKTPCGFCFVEYIQREDALSAVAHLSGTKLNGKVIRVELDAGFQPGREFGRGASGGQVRDDRRRSQDPARTSNKRGRSDHHFGERPSKTEDTGDDEPSAKRQRT